MPWVGRSAEKHGRKPLLLVGFAAPPIRAVFFALIKNPLALMIIQLLDVITGAVLGVMTAVVIADVTKGTGPFQSGPGNVRYDGGRRCRAQSTLTGLIVDEFGRSAGFASFAAEGLVALLILAIFLPETKEALPHSVIDSAIVLRRDRSMIHHVPQRPPFHDFPADEWNVIEKGFHPEFLAQLETMLALGNGYLGMRGCPEEGGPNAENATLINGFYETRPIVYGEEAYGFAKTGQTILSVTDSKIIKLFVDDEPFWLPNANLLRYDRRLNMKSGTLDREILWETPAGKQVSITSRRLVSFANRHVAAISYRVTLLNAAASLVISSEMAANEPSASSTPTIRDRLGSLPVGYSITEPAMPKTVGSCCATRPKRAA